MRAAEKLIAQRGVEAITIRDIVSAAGQKNESALQYHFSSLGGLVDAIVSERAGQIRDKREELLAALQERQTAPYALRELVTLMVQPAFDLACASLAFRRFVKAFGHELALADESAIIRAARRGGAGGRSGMELATLLRSALAHLDDVSFRSRLEAAIRLSAISMYHQARTRGAFSGTQAELFFQQLIDALEGLLSAPVSSATLPVIEKAMNGKAANEKTGQT